jgi:NO-binding membrane sensor protein with MHYT domain
MSATTFFDILLVLVAVLVTWFAAFVVLKLFKGQ